MATSDEDYGHHREDDEWRQGEEDRDHSRSVRNRDPSPSAGHLTTSMVQVQREFEGRQKRHSLETALQNRRKGRAEWKPSSGYSSRIPDTSPRRKLTLTSGAHGAVSRGVEFGMFTEAGGAGPIQYSRNTVPPNSSMNNRSTIGGNSGSGSQGTARQRKDFISTARELKAMADSCAKRSKSELENKMGAWREMALSISTNNEDNDDGTARLTKQGLTPAVLDAYQAMQAAYQECKYATDTFLGTLLSGDEKRLLGMNSLKVQSEKDRESKYQYHNNKTEPRNPPPRRRPIEEEERQHQEGKEPTHQAAAQEEIEEPRKTSNDEPIPPKKAEAKRGRQPLRKPVTRNSDSDSSSSPDERRKAPARKPPTPNRKSTPKKKKQLNSTPSKRSGSSDARPPPSPTIAPQKSSAAPERDTTPLKRSNSGSRLKPRETKAFQLRRQSSQEKYAEEDMGELSSSINGQERPTGGGTPTRSSSKEAEPRTEKKTPSAAAGTRSSGSASQRTTSAGNTTKQQEQQQQQPVPKLQQKRTVPEDEPGVSPIGRSEEPTPRTGRQDPPPATAPPQQQQDPVEVTTPPAQRGSALSRANTGYQQPRLQQQQQQQQQPANSTSATGGNRRAGGRFDPVVPRQQEQQQTTTTTASQPSGGGDTKREGEVTSPPPPSDSGASTARSNKSGKFQAYLDKINANRLSDSDEDSSDEE